MTPELHGYQRVAVDHLRRNRRAALFLDMGLGKTAATLSALTPEHLPALVVAPKRVAENVWPEEARLWRPDLRLALAAGEPKRRREALASRADIVVLGRDNLADAKPVRDRFRTIVLDESSGFKSRESNRWKVARSLGLRHTGRNIWAVPPGRHMWQLTGTPAPNGLMDLWAPTYLLDAGERLGRNLTTFRGRYFIPGRQLANGVITEWWLRDGAEQAIHRKLEDIALSMQSDGLLELPPVTYNQVEVPLPPKVRSLYKKFKRDLVLDLELIGGTKHVAENAAILTSKLAQLTGGFLYQHDDLGEPLGTWELLHREKLRAVAEIAEGTGSPLLVFYQYEAEKRMLLESLPPGTAFTTDEPDLQTRWNRGEFPVLLAHPASAGHGLNLQKGPGHTIVWYSLPWSLEEWQQANKRLLRQGQAHHVIIHMLMAPRTVDATKLAALTGKATVQQALLDHLESPL